MTYSIWLEPIKKDTIYLKNIINYLAKKYDSPIFDPHVTIDSEIKELPTNEKMIKTFQQILKVDIFSHNLQFSDYIWKTLFIQLKKNLRLEQIRKMFKDEFNYNSSYNFEPHISLVYKKLNNNIKKQIIQNIKIKSKFTFDKISIIYSTKEVKEWKKILTINLKN
ncbi:MAG: hydrolase [Thaumarchaeota archaeon]|nr:MAG: hydrolase [Nitrososphaerota archaeon]